MADRKKSILIHDWCGHPFTFDLSKELALRGYVVHHVYTLASAGPKAQISEAGDSLMVHHVDFEPIQKSKFITRWFQDRAYGERVARIVDKVRPDVVMSANTPLESQHKILHACQKKNIPFLFWQQDIISIAARSILSKNNKLFGVLIGRYFENLEKRMLQQSHRIIVIADDFKSTIAAWGISTEKIDVIPNWAPIADIPMLQKKNAFSIKHNLVDKFVVLYSGTMGMKHNPRMIVRLATHFSNDPRIQFVVATDGVGRMILNDALTKKQLPNLLLLPLQPFEIFPQVLASADILLVLLERDAGLFSVPSKVWSGFCAAKPTLMAAPKDNLAAQVTQRINAGVVVSSDDFDGAVAEIIRFSADEKKRSLMGKNARNYAEEHFPVGKVAQKFERIFQNIFVPLSETKANSI